MYLHYDFNSKMIYHFIQVRQKSIKSFRYFFLSFSAILTPMAMHYFVFFLSVSCAGGDAWLYMCLFILAVSVLLISFFLTFPASQACPVFALWMIRSLLQFRSVRKDLKKTRRGWKGSTEIFATREEDWKKA